MLAVRLVDNRFGISALCTLATIALGGCASTAPVSGSGSASATASTIDAQMAELALQKAELARREAALAQRQMQLEARAASPAGATSDTQAGGGSIIPLDATPGECYAQVIIPAKFRFSVEEVVQRPRSERIEIVPARFKMVEEEVVIREASTRIEVVPAVYETIKERVMIKEENRKLVAVPAIYETITEEVEIEPASTRIIEVPAVYETVTEQVLDEPARREWKYVTEIDTGSGEVSTGAAQMVQRYGDFKVLETRVKDTGVMCLVEYPATYKLETKQVIVTPATTRVVEVAGKTRSVTRTIVKQPASTREEIVPAEYGTVEKTIVKTPASTREVTIPATYGKVKVRKLVEPAHERRIPIPEEVTTRSVKEKVSDARIEWRPVLCKVNMTRENVSAMQAALNTKAVGRTCKVDGIMGPCTLDIARRFAIANGLAWGQNYVTMDVIRELGLSF